MVVWVSWRLNGIVNELLECLALADELNQFRDAATAAKHHKFFLLLKELFDCATFLLVEKLVDLDVSSETTNALS